MDATSNIKPWVQRQWRDGCCRHQQGRTMLALWLLTAIFVAAFASFARWSPHMLRFGRVGWQVVFPYVLGAVGAGLFRAALLRTARWLRFGRCRLHLSTLPGVIGGYFRGELQLPARFPEQADVYLELLCERVVMQRGSGQDDASSQRTERVWAHTLRAGVCAGGVDGRRCAAPFDFEVPFGLPDATDSRPTATGREAVRWRLRAFSRLSGPDLSLTFNVPVFKTTASDPSVRGSSHDGKPLEAFLHDTGQTRRVRMECDGVSNVFVCGAQGFQTGLCVVPSLIGLALLAVAVLAPANALPELFRDLLRAATGWENLQRLIPLVFIAGTLALSSIFGLLGLLALLIGLRGLIFRRTWIEQGVIRQRASLFGIPWRRSWPCISATGVSAEGTTKAGDRVWHDVVITCNASPSNNEAAWRRDLFGRVTVATHVPSQHEAEDLAARLRRELRLPEGATGQPSSG